MRNKFFIIFALMSSLAGCTHQLLVPDIRDPQSYQQQLAQLDHWQIEGKIGVRHANKSDSAALRWQQDENYFDIYLSGPLGAGATRLVGTPKKLVMQNGKQETISTADPEQMIEKHLGWTLPLEKLPQWILGYSDNANAHLNNKQFNADHTLANFSEGDWQIKYQRYQIVDQWLLPEKIVLTHEDMQVTIFIKRWELH